MEKGLVIHPIVSNKINNNYKLQEAVNLTTALDIQVADRLSIAIKNINPATFFHSGNVDKIKQIIQSLKIDLIVINTGISPIQQRNLEKILNTKVLDRTGLIIHIFSKRAKSKEGQLQSQLASLMYQKSRLVKAWSHLERQRGGGGFIGGPGETQKELDKRMLSKKIETLKNQLKKVTLNKSIQSQSRKKNDFLIVALVGYTNSGKSTLFNTLSDSNIFAKDMLFATLDTTLRVLKLNNKQNILISDTVGFISDLPHQLINAFHSTLQEVEYADIILHVIDASNENYNDQRNDVINILKELNIDDETYKNKVIEVYNKIDNLKFSDLYNLYKDHLHLNNICHISAKTTKNIPKLKQLIQNKTTSNMLTKTIILNNPINSILLNYIHNNSIVSNTTTNNENTILDVKITFENLDKLNNLIIKNQNSITIL